MAFRSLRPLLALVTAGSVVTLSGCAATQVALDHHHLEVQSKMSSTIFLTPVAQSEQTVYLQLKNTADHSLNIPALTQELDASLTNQGYRVVPYQKAHYLLQVNILSIGKSSPSAAQTALGAGYGGALFGAVAGGAIGGSWQAAGAGGLIAGVGSMVADSLVHNTTYAMITDVQLGVRTRRAVTNATDSTLQQGSSSTTVQQTGHSGHWVDYRTRIVSTANQVNLSFVKAVPALQGQLVHALAGVL